MRFQECLVSFIIRTNDSRRLNDLIYAINSILENVYRPIEILVIVQTEDTSFFEIIQRRCDELSKPDCLIYLFMHETQSDARAKNLNIGIKNAQGRYICFLDDDDIIYTTYISSMINGLKTQRNAWIYGDVDISTYDSSSGCSKLLIKDSRFKKKNYKYFDLFFDNHIPIHSFMIDRFRIQDSDLCFDETVECLEDYIFLILFAFKYEPLYLREKICEYRIRLDGSNSVMIGTSSILKLDKWRKAEERLNFVREKILKNFEFDNRVLYNYLWFKYIWLKKLGKLNRLSKPSLSSQSTMLMKIKKQFPHVWHNIGSLLSKSGII
jgi:glycosyltransferase involved in cell wall biosynthesis